MVGHFGCISICDQLNKKEVKVYSLVQLVLFRDMILSIKYKVDWELIRQPKQTLSSKDNIRENIKQVDHNYKVIDKVMLNNNAAHKYETLYRGPFVKIQCRNKVSVVYQCGETKIRYYICWIKQYTSDTNIADISTENMYDDVKI